MPDDTLEAFKEFIHFGLTSQDINNTSIPLSLKEASTNQLFPAIIEIIKKHGIQDIIIDPGFGFGKTLEHNFDLFKNIPFFKSLNTPILIGITGHSTETMFLKYIGKTSYDNAYQMLEYVNKLQPRKTQQQLKIVKSVNK